MSEETTFHVGDQPGTGKYRCCKCGNYVAVLIQPADQIPPCENCDSDPDVRYEVDNQEATVSHGP
jgi:hypothetical protein